MTKPTMWLCAQRRLRSAWASAQSDQSLRCPHEESWVPKLPIERTAKSLIRLGGCPVWSESSLGAQSFYWCCHEAAHFLLHTILRKRIHITTDCSTTYVKETLLIVLIVPKLREEYQMSMACTILQSYHCNRRALNGYPRTKSFFVQTGKTSIKLLRCTDWSMIPVWAHMTPCTIWATSRENLSSEVCNQVRLKPACSASETS